MAKLAQWQCTVLLNFTTGKTDKYLYIDIYEIKIIGFPHNNFVGLLLSFCSCSCHHLISPAEHYLKHLRDGVLWKSPAVVAFSHSPNTHTLLVKMWGNKTAKARTGCLVSMEDSSFNPGYRFNPNHYPRGCWQGWERDWEKGMSVGAHQTREGEALSTLLIFSLWFTKG